MKIKIDGVTYDAPEAVVKFMTAQQERLDEVEARLDEADTIDVKAVVRERVALINKARRVLGNQTKLDEMDDIDIKKAVITKRHPGIKLDDREPAYINARFDAVIETLPSAIGTARSAGAPVTQPADRTDEGDKDYIKELRSQWKKPLTYTAP